MSRRAAVSAFIRPGSSKDLSARYSGRLRAVSAIPPRVSLRIPKPLRHTVGQGEAGRERADAPLHVVLNRRACEISAEDAAKVYGAAVYATSKRRLAKRELRRWPIPAGA